MKKTIVFSLFIMVLMAAVAFAQYPEYTIREIQEVPVGADSSIYEGDTVHVGGIVVAGTGLYYAGSGVTFYMEMADGGPFSGVMAYNPTSEGFPDLIPGDSISVDALVSEYAWPYDPPYGSNMTELFIVPGSFTFHSFGNPEPEPMVVTADLIDTTGGYGVVDSLGEQFEGVYVRIYEVTVDSVIPYTNTATWICHDTTGHQFMVRDASDSIAYLPTVGTQFSYVNGVVYHRFNNYNIQPRYMRDIQFPSGAPIIGNVGHFPEFPFDDDPVTISANVFDDVEVDNVELYFRQNLGSWISVYMNEGDNDEYWFTLPALPAGSRVDYYIEAEDDEGAVRTEPSEAPWNFYTYRILTPVEMTIAEARADGDGDFLPDLEDSAATLTGIATSYNFSTDRTDFFMEDGVAGISVLMFDEMLNVNIGDSITATGVIAEYYGKVQLMVYDPERITNHGAASGSLDTLELTCEDLAEIEGEQYECRLARILNVTIIEEPDSWPELGVSATLTIQDVTGQTLLRIDRSTNIPGQYMPTEPQNIVGCVGQYDYDDPPDGGYQLTPRRFLDFEPYLTIDEEENLPRATSLSQNYPNPFNPSTSVSYYLAEPGDVDFVIYDLLGREVFEANYSDVQVGSHSITWEGIDSGGKPVATGLYFYRLKVGDFSDTRQMLLLK
ncbi:MAG: T9SS type A sorting domain-containing protein [candidate division Zixibacteria bacterium]|nr:T9SS type A sorting domain-containing protein [candidate division Zixibacteria bacterium]